MSWPWYAAAAAVLYGLHQVFTKMASGHISDGLGGLTVEFSAASTIALYLGVLKVAGMWTQTANTTGLIYSVLTGVCVGFGTICFFLMFQKGGPLSAVPAVLAIGAALMVLIGIFGFGEPADVRKLLGMILSICAFVLLWS